MASFPKEGPVRVGWSHSHLPHVELDTNSSDSELLMANVWLWWISFAQFNRCITSQMIKWFSNFREFYYIQTEKFARQAISDGVTNPKMLMVLRDSELFRALNVHYNKGNDFEVRQCTGSREVWAVSSLYDLIGVLFCFVFKKRSPLCLSLSQWESWWFEASICTIHKDYSLNISQATNMDTAVFLLKLQHRPVRCLYSRLITL
jgi:hypothetical protein